MFNLPVFMQANKSVEEMERSLVIQEVPKSEGILVVFLEILPIIERRTLRLSESE